MFLCMALVVVAASVGVGPGGARVGVETALAADCKPKVICEGIDLGVWTWRACWKFSFDFLC
jgi:hypothetical protein